MRLDLDGLAAASREALMAEWREVVGRPPPKHSYGPGQMGRLKFTASNTDRPKGSRNKATIAIESLLQGQAEALTQTAVTKH